MAPTALGVQDGALEWSALLRRLDRIDGSYRE